MYDNVMRVKFEIEDVDGKITREFDTDDCASWTELMLKYADFLSAQYGYGIAEKMRFITDHPFGRDRDYAISTEDWSWLEKHKERFQRQSELFNDWGDDE
jgi:outer membrane protein assembly factor BamD (BamD/ComL family)